MFEKEGVKEPAKLSRREFLKDAGIVVGSTAFASAFFLSACGEEKEVTKTVTTTAAGGAITQTQTITKYVCPVCNTEFDNISALASHMQTAHPGEGEIITKYVCPYCDCEFGSLIELQAHIEETAPAGTGKVLHLTVNGKEQVVNVEPNITLQDMLREKLGFMSPKDMCFGYGACGSCSVIMNSRPVLSCMVLACECEDAEIETAEGIADAKHPIVDAYIKHHAMQCGYCTPGFLITSKALLDHNPNPTEADIRDILGGNICRCGTYPAHIRAVLEAATKL